MENFIKEVEVDGVNHDITLGDNMVGHGLKKDENGVVGSDIIKITYSELKLLRDNSQLSPGTFYRITDYVTTTTQSETKSANHPFDVIVLALNENTLCEDAKAILHEGDTYFADNDLGAWELKYCLDNDKTRFLWADETNGKGVIYRMVDEKRNDCPYDFKNILFYNTKLTHNTTADKYYYTFSYVVSNVLYDGTTNKQVKNCYENMMGEYRIYSSGVLQLNKNVFRNNTFNSVCHSNTFGTSCHSNTFENGCYYNTFEDNCYYNTFGDNCSSNTFENGCYSNTFEKLCYYNTFGTSCHSNTFEDNCYYNTFGTSCHSNTFEDNCYSNTFGNLLNNRSLDSFTTTITLNEEFYDDGSGQLVPIKHPDLSTQPSILPYKFMGQYVYEQLIPVNKGDRVVNNEFAVETPAIISAEMFGVNSFKSINIFAVKSNALLLDTSSELDGYINVKYTDGSVLLPSDGYYYDSTSTQPSNNSSIDFGITGDGTVYMYDNDTLTLSKNDEINNNSIPSQYKNSSKIIIDNNVTSIGERAFSNCTGLTSVVIPNSVISIGSYAFNKCSGLTSVEIPNSVTSIGDWAFGYCSSLTSVEIPNSVTSIGGYAFYSCSGLTSVVIGNSVTSIGDSAFYGCTNVISITCEAIYPPGISMKVFNGISKSIPVCVPAESVEAYKSANYWNEFTNIQAINEL
jgi:hypothetical protein